LKNRILLFDTITDGHHPDYLIHLIGFYSGNQEVELFVATGESFKSQFDARQKDENNQWGDNVTFLGIPTDQLNSIHSKPIYLRSIIEWNLLVETAKEINASHVLLMYFDYYQLGILIGKKAPFAVSAIYFRPNFSENDHGIYPQIKKWMLSKVLNSGQIQNLFCLVHALVPYMKGQKTQTQIIPICDPIKQFEISKSETAEFKNKYKIPEDKKICGISLDEIRENQNYMCCTHCHNNFNENDIRIWLRSRRTCPNCRGIWSDYNIYINSLSLVLNVNVPY